MTVPDVVITVGPEQGMLIGTNVTIMLTPEYTKLPSLVNVTVMACCEPVTAEGNALPLVRNN